MFVDFAPIEKATCRLALDTYDKALEKHNREADKLGLGDNMAIKIAQGRCGSLTARFRREHDDVRTIEFTADLRVCLNDALKYELAELKKKEDWLELHLVDRRDLERQLGRVETLIGRMNDQYALEMEVPVRLTDDGAQEIRAAREKDLETGRGKRKDQNPPLH